MKKEESLAIVSSKVDTNLAQKFQKARETTVSFEDFLREFLQNFVSPQTKRAYQTDFESFFGFVKSGGEIIRHPKDLQAFHFQLYRDHLIEQGKSSATINRQLVAIRSFMKWALAAKLIEHNPLSVVKLPKVQTESPTLAFDDEEVARMIEAPDAGTPKGALHRITLVLLFHLGLRRSELTGLRPQDFFQDRGHHVLRIHGKGGKIRLLPIAPVVARELRAYSEFLLGQGIRLEADEHLLQADPLKSRGVPMDGSTVYRMVSKYARELGINKRVSPHSCRATVISHLLDTQKTPIRDVAIFAGHANVTTTERYDKRRQGLDESAAYEVDFRKTR